MNLEDLKGIGTKTSKLLNKLNIFTLNDLIEYYPYRFNILERTNLVDNEEVVIDGIVESIPNVFYFNKRMNRMTLRINTNNKIINISIFNRAFLKPNIKVGNYITVIGKYDMKHNTITASDIKLFRLPNNPIIEPIYHVVKGITSNQLNKIILNNIELYNSEELIPDNLIDKYYLLNKKDSISVIHSPKDKNSLNRALSYLKYEEVFLFMLKINYLKNKRTDILGIKRNINKEDVDKFIDTLPFKLTIDQNKCIDNILNDLNSNNRMNRLLQGDVGSGKTICAVIALYINYLSGYQGVLMAPTEILSIQHYNNITKLFKDTNIKVELLTGKLKVSEKKEIYKKLLNKEIDILIGTHALFSNDVVYSNLGLVITDEQHRFGVNQRSSLKDKGINPDILYMSATPIPRTYAITLYGDMDISSIHTMPSGRKEVITLLKSEKELKDILDIMLQELKNKHQVYVVAPLIEDEEGTSDNENVIELKEKIDKAFGKYFKSGILHGKMSKEDKDSIMDKFKNNEINILISTTVIEVGVDVENATTMVIWDSYRFGLSQLHQLRGRVGRNNLQSYCVLVSNKETERLNILTTTNDGFKVSEEDFKLRGSGDLFGTRQSGDMQFKIANIKRDFNILLRAKEDTQQLLDSKLYVNSNLYKFIENSIDIS